MGKRTRMPAPPFNRFFDFDELTEYLKALADARPGLVRLGSLGKSRGRPAWLPAAREHPRGRVVRHAGGAPHG
jgi:hypothetical protein